MRINIKLLAGTLAAMIVFVVGVYYLHAFQVRRNAGSLKSQAATETENAAGELKLAAAERAQGRSDRERLEKAQHHREKAVDYLRRYLGLVPNDVDALVQYVDLREKFIRNDRDVLVVLELYEKILRLDGGQSEIRRKAIKLSMSLRRWADALEHIDAALKKEEKMVGELFYWKGLCQKAVGKENVEAEAEASFKKAYETDPSLTDSYLQRALILRARHDRIISADDTAQRKKALREEIEETLDLMEANNKESYASYLTLLKYYSLTPIEGDKIDAWKVKRADAVTNALEFGREKTADLLYIYLCDGFIPFPVELQKVKAEVLQAAADWARQNQPEEHRKYLQWGVFGYPKDLRFCEALSHLELEAGNKDLAQKYLLAYLANQPGRADSAQARYYLGEILVESGELLEARKIEGQLRQDTNSSVLADCLDGHILFAEGKWWEAIRVLERTRVQLATLPVYARRVDLVLAACYERIGEPDLWLAACQRAVSVDPVNPGVRAKLALALAANGRVDEALGELRHLAAQEKALELTVARLLAARVAQMPKAEQKARWEEVEAHLGEADKALPKSPHVPLLRATILAIQEQFDKARACLEEARDKNPDEVLLWIGLADLADSQGKTKDALLILEEAHKRFADSVELRIALVRHWAGERRPEARPATVIEADKALAELENEAIAQLEKDAAQSTQVPRERRVQQAQVLSALAKANRRAGPAKQKEAERLWTMVAKLQDNDLNSRLELLELALASRDEDKAAQCIEDIKRLEGADGTRWRAERAALLLSFGKDSQNWGEIDALLREAAQRRPNWPRVPRLQAELAERQHNDDRAIEHLQRAVDLKDPDPQLISRLTGLLFKRGRDEDANVVLLKAAENNPLLGAEIAFTNKDYQRAREKALQAVPDDERDYQKFLWLALFLSSLDDADKAESALQKAKALVKNGNINDPVVWVDAILVYHNAVVLSKDPKKLEKYQLALKAAVKEAEEKLTAIQAPLALARCYGIVGRTQEAEKLFEKALRDKPDDVPTLRLVAAYYQLHQQPQKAEPLLRTILDPKIKAPELEVAWARRTLGPAIASRGDARQVDEALQLLEKNLQADANSVVDVRAKAWILANQTDRLQEAIDLFENLEKRAPPLAPEDMFTLARLYEAAHNWSKARDRMHTLVLTAPNNPAYLAAFANGLIHNAKNHAEDLEEAEQMVTLLERIEPKALTTLQLRVRLLIAQQNPGEAVKRVYSRADEKDLSLEALAFMLEAKELEAIELGALEKAEGLFKRLAFQEKKKPEDVLPLALFYARHNRSAEGLRICEQARETCPPEQVAQVSVAVLRAKATTDTQRDGVEEWLKYAINSKSTVELRVVWAELQDLRGRYPQAEEAWRAVLKDQPNHIVALNNLACLLAFRGAKGEEPLQLTNKAIYLAGPVPELLDSRALVNLSQGNPAPAVNDMVLAVKRRPTATKYYHLSRAYQAAGDTDRARDAWRKAVEAKLKQEDLHPLEAEEYKKHAAKMGAG